MLLTDYEISVLKNRYNLYEEKAYNYGCEGKLFFYKDQHSKIQLFSVTRNIRSNHSCWKLYEVAEFSDAESFSDFKVIENPNIYSFTDLNLRVMEKVNKLALCQKIKLLSQMKHSMESDFND